MEAEKWPRLIELPLSIEEEVTPYIDQLIKTSPHQSPIVALIMQGVGESGSEIDQKWVVTTVDKEALELIKFVYFERLGYTIYSTHSDMEVLPELLGTLKINIENEQIVVEGDNCVAF